MSKIRSAVNDYMVILEQFAVQCKPRAYHKKILCGNLLETYIFRNNSHFQQGWINFVEQHVKALASSVYYKLIVTYELEKKHYKNQ